MRNAAVRMSGPTCGAVFCSVRGTTFALPHQCGKVSSRRSSVLVACTSSAQDFSASQSSPLLPTASSQENLSALASTGSSSRRAVLLSLCSLLAIRVLPPSALAAEPQTEDVPDGSTEAPPASKKKKRRPVEEDRGPEVIRRFSTPGGVRVEEVVVGSGDMEAEVGDIVTFHYVCRRTNGYFVASTVDPLGKVVEPVQLPLGPDGQMIQGLTEVIQGMKAGGKRRALVPPEAGYTSRDLQPLPEEYDRQRALYAHAQEPLVFEVRLLNIRRV